MDGFLWYSINGDRGSWGVALSWTVFPFFALPLFFTVWSVRSSLSRTWFSFSVLGLVHVTAHSIFRCNRWGPPLRERGSFSVSGDGSDDQCDDSASFLRCNIAPRSVRLRRPYVPVDKIKGAVRIWMWVIIGEYSELEQQARFSWWKCEGKVFWMSSSIEGVGSVRSADFTIVGYLSITDILVKI